MCMKKYFLLMLVSGILLGANEKELTIEKILNNENVVAAATVSAKQSTAKKEEKKAAAVPKKTVNTATNNKVATPQNNAKTTVNENTKAKQTTEVKKAAVTKNTGAVNPQKITDTVIDRDRTKQFNDPKNLEKGSYCNKPVGRHQFQEINDKGEYRADIKFQYCMINNEKKENVTIGIIGTDLNAISGYIKKYAYLHLKNTDKLHLNADGKSYYYDGVWAWSNSSDYPMSAWEEKANTNKGK